MITRLRRSNPLALLLSVWVTCSSARSSSSEKALKQSHNVSSLLDELLVDYDNSLRPDIGGPPLVVNIDIVVRSMGPISEADMTFSLDCYFRQTWRDDRLQHQHSGFEPLALSISMLKRIWKPDTYFYNGKHSYLHTITTPNKLVRLFPDGRILYSSRLTIKASCPMHLQNFPMDIQLCPLYVGSFAYTSKDVLYRWNEEHSVHVDPNMKMSQFDLISNPVSNYTLSVSSGQYSMLSAMFRLRRHTGSFLIQVYGPCILLVVLSWVSFWLNREATSDRVSLGVTTVLTMTFLGLEARATLPKVPYPTALDYFIFLSFGFIFATIVQFAVVHYYTKVGFGEVYFEFVNSDETKARRATVPGTPMRNSTPLPPPPPPPITHYGRQGKGREIYSIDMQLTARREEVRVQLQNDSCGGSLRKAAAAQAAPQAAPQYPQQHARINRPWDVQQMNSVSQIDKISRVVFPLLFLVINLFYWCTYIVEDP